MKIQLGYYLNTCPVAWCNWIEHMMKTVPRNTPGDGFTEQTINEKLKPWGAVYSDKENTLEFCDRKYYTAWLLAFG